MQFMQKFRKKIGKKTTATFKPRGRNTSSWFPELISYEQRSITKEDPIFPEGGATSSLGGVNIQFCQNFQNLHEIERIWIPSASLASPLISTNALTNLSWLPPSHGELAPFPGFTLEKRHAFLCSFQQIIRKIIGFWELVPLLRKILDPPPL